MIVARLVQVNLLLDRHRKLVSWGSWTVFAVICADYARFIELPVILDIPTKIAGMLAGARYVLWEGWLKRVVDRRTQEARAAAALAANSAEAGGA